MPNVSQSRAFAAVAFLGRDVLLFSLSSSSSSSKSWLLNNKMLLSLSSHRYDPEEREGENLGATRRQSWSKIRSSIQNRSAIQSPSVSWSQSVRRRQRQRSLSGASKQGRTTGPRRDLETGRRQQRTEMQQQRRQEESEDEYKDQ